jgi:hypothetical protein
VKHIRHDSLLFDLLEILLLVVEGRTTAEVVQVQRLGVQRAEVQRLHQLHGEHVLVRPRRLHHVERAHDGPRQVDCLRVGHEVVEPGIGVERSVSDGGPLPIVAEECLRRLLVRVLRLEVPDEGVEVGEGILKPDNIHVLE